MGRAELPGMWTGASGLCYSWTYVSTRSSLPFQRRVPNCALQFFSTFDEGLWSPWITGVKESRAKSRFNSEAARPGEKAHTQRNSGSELSMWHKHGSAWWGSMGRTRIERSRLFILLWRTAEHEKKKRRNLAQQSNKMLWDAGQVWNRDGVSRAGWVDRKLACAQRRFRPMWPWSHLGNIELTNTTNNTMNLECRARSTVEPRPTTNWLLLLFRKYWSFLWPIFLIRSFSCVNTSMIRLDGPLLAGVTQFNCATIYDDGLLKASMISSVKTGHTQAGALTQPKVAEGRLLGCQVKRPGAIRHRIQSVHSTYSLGWRDERGTGLRCECESSMVWSRHGTCWPMGGGRVGRQEREWLIAWAHTLSVLPLIYYFVRTSMAVCDPRRQFLQMCKLPHAMTKWSILHLN